MNWKEIKKKYPKAWELLKRWLGYKKDITVSIELSKIFMPERKLYDFFDEQGIYGNCFSWKNESDNVRFYWGIEEYFRYKDDEYIRTEAQKDYSLRKEAEEVMWLKEFEILEEKLN